MEESHNRFAARLALYRNFFAAMAARGVGPDASWGDFVGRLQFRLGESIAEAHVPYAMADDVRDPVAQAVEELVALVRRRHEPGYNAQVWDNLSVEPRLRVKMRPRAYPIHRYRDHSDDAAAIRAAMTMDPLLDAGIIEAWLVKDGTADRLAAVLGGLYGRLVKAECAGCEPIAALFHVCLIREILAQKQAGTEQQLKGIVYEKLERAIGVALHVLHRTILDACGRAMGPLALDPAAQTVFQQMALSLSPISYVAIRKAALQQDHNPYGISAQAAALLDPMLLDPAVRDPVSAAAGLRERVDAVPDLREHLLLLHAAPRFREAAIALLSCRDARAFHDAAPWADILPSDDAVSALLRGKDGRAIAAAVDDAAAKAEKGSTPFRFAMAAGAAIEDAAALTAGRPPRDRNALTDDLVARFLAGRLDAGTAARLDGVIARLDDRRGRGPLAQVKAEYEEGRLYRFSADERPIINTRVTATCGQLFVDLKGFTKRTYRAKELVMADFLRDRFYGPLILAAHRLSLDRFDRHDPARLDVVNLLGDAIALSGSVTSLVAFAREAREVFAAYAQTLQQMLASGGVADRIAEVRRRQAAADAKMAAAIDEATRALSEGGAAPGSVDLLRRAARLGDLRARRAAVRDEADDEVRRIGGFGLESGLFISFGAAHELLQMKNEHWGDLRAAVGETINEAARGTARSALVKARVDGRLEDQQARTGRTGLVLPFAVYVDTYTTLALPADVGALFEEAAAGRDLKKAAEGSKLLAQHIFLDFERLASAESGAAPRLLATATDIHNVGQAMSADALDVYIRERRTDTIHATRTVRIEELHLEIRERFAFFEPSQTFIVSCDTAKGGALRDVFRRAGQVLFRGFEARRPTVVYEILDPRSPFFELLAAHHARRWAAEAAADPAGAMAGLPPEEGGARA